MVELDYEAARRATTATAVVMALLVAGQMAVAAAVTGGQQPLVATDEVPQTAESDRWSEAPSRTVSLSKQQMAVPYGGGSVDEMEVQALTNETHVAFRLTWTDPTKDTNIRSPKNYSDAAAVMLHSGEKPPITMGAGGDPVNIWYWRSQWQYGNDKNAEWSNDMYAYPHPDEETKPGMAAGNPLSQSQYENYGQNYYAAGYGSLSNAPQQNVNARGTRNGDEWSVVFVREHTGEGQHDAAFRQNETMYLAFAVWNGSSDEVNGKKSLTMQYSTLDTESGELTAPESGGSGDSSSSGSGASGGGSSGGDSSSGDGGSGGSSNPLYTSLGTLIAATVAGWTVLYWRLAR
ncbi:ethylbenzene dehydrogenase-related protein [Haloarcula sp. K1]|uniref:ethylbenzene dehydrogenase-related protein n=1 Tax=Haloarcula sp. K1 TaxID=1622207 RepID=UPI0007BC343B|nr:ethylbenzene dehydrogenase-related protein [Haloarcula sp. K1]KZX50060.1 cytochrome C nitrite reductase [Haloarcula sp. K1]